MFSVNLHALLYMIASIPKLQELHHISIADIIHGDINVPEIENCKKVTIKYIPELSRNWKDKYNKNQNQQECKSILSVSESDVNTTSLLLQMTMHA